MQQQLYAAGFNAWGQLRWGPPDDGPPDGDDPGDPGDPDDPDDPDDLDDVPVFSCVLADAAIRDVWPSLTYTAVETSRGLRTAGAVPSGGADDADDEGDAGDADDFRCAEALNGRCVAIVGGVLEQYASRDAFVQQQRRRRRRRRQHHGEADASDGAAATRFEGLPRAVQAVAYDAGFAALTADGQVWTWGDSRYPECLGREADTADGADRPGRVAALADLPTGPVVRLAAGGYVLAALTRGGDLYCWGGYAGRRRRVLAGLGGTPAPVVVTRPPAADSSSSSNDPVELDLVDVGVGEAHMIALAADGTVCVVGSDANGQLGWGRDRAGDHEPGWLDHWAPVDLPLRRGQRATRVFAGPRSSFIVVDASE